MAFTSSFLHGSSMASGIVFILLWLMAPKHPREESSSPTGGRGERAGGTSKGRKKVSKKGATTSGKGRPPKAPKAPKAKPPTPLPSRFIDRDAYTKYTDFILSRTVNIEQALDQAKAPPALLKNLRDREWDQLLVTPDHPPNFSIVREFFANFSSTPFDTTTVQVRNVQIERTIEAFNEAYGLPAFSILPDQDYTAVFHARKAKGEDVEELARLALCPNVPWVLKKNKRSHLLTAAFSDDTLTLLKFVLNRLHPNLNHSRLTKKDLLLMYAIHTKIPVDVGVCVCTSITAILKDSTKDLIFPHLICKLALDAKVPIFTDDFFPSKNPEATVGKSPFARHNHPPPPPPPLPTLEQNFYLVAAANRDWEEENRAILYGLRHALQALADSARLNISDCPYPSKTPREYPAALDAYIPRASPICPEATVDLEPTGQPHQGDGSGPSGIASASHVDVDVVDDEDPGAMISTDELLLSRN